MKVTVTTRHQSNKKKAEELKAYATEKSKRIEKHLGTEREPSELRIVLSSEKYRNSAEFILQSVHTKFTSNVETEDMHTSIDNATNAIIKQVRKHTDKLITSKRRGGSKAKEETGAPEAVGYTEYENIVIHKLPEKLMSIEEASLQLKVSDANFVAFRNRENNEMNVVYINRRGKVILIEP